MPGVTKHIYDHEIRDIMKMWNMQLKELIAILPAGYYEDDIVQLLKKYYPHEWKSVEYKYWYYCKKDQFLKNRGKKERYKMKKPENLIKDAQIFKMIMSKEYRLSYKQNYSSEVVRKCEQELSLKRNPKIEKINEKIEKAKEKVQLVTPDFLDALIGLYERKSTSQKDKVYILSELKKYYNHKIINFFFKLNDTELNKQLRWVAFYHLQSFNYQPRARRQKFMQIHTKNKKRKAFLKKVYPDLKYCIPKNPEELEYRIENSKEQAIKKFDYFISHSSKDAVIVQRLIKEENKNGNNVFCDWLSDSDYLKRHLVCEATLKVIEKRLEQSDGLIFVESENSKQSIWCKYELNYFYDLQKPIYVVSKDEIENGVYNLELDKTVWFLDPGYKDLALTEGEKIST